MFHLNRKAKTGAPQLALLALVMGAVAVPGYGQAVFNQNLVVNPGAEAGEAAQSNTDPQIKDIPGWEVTGMTSVARFGGTDLMGADDYGPAERGEKYFSGGPQGSKSTIRQTIDLSATSAEVDGGRVRFYFAGYLGSSGGIEPTSLISLTATFKDAAGRTLLTSAVGGPSDKELGYGAGLVLRANSGYLLPNTRSVELTLDMSNPDATFNSFGADNLTLVLKLEPVMGVNILWNGGAEIPDGSGGADSSMVPVPGWTGHAFIQSATYEGKRISEKTLMPADGGENLFAAYGNGTISVAQAVDVTLAKDLIEAGRVTFNFSVWLGTCGTCLDTAEAKLEFLDAQGGVISRGAAGMVKPEDIGGEGVGLLERTGQGAVPAATRRVRVTITFTNLDPTQFEAYADNVSLVLSAGAAELKIQDKGIVNSASGVFGAVAPGEMVTILTTGVDLASTVRMQLDGEGKVARELGGVKVYFDGTQAPILYVSSSQIGAIVPFDVDGKSGTQVRVEYKGVKSNTVSMTVAATAPGVFTQEGTPKGAGLIYDAGWTLVSASNAAAKGSIVTVIWTGGGQTTPAGVDGRMETQGMAKPKAAVTARIGGQTARVVFAGSLPYTWAGLLMAQIEVPVAATAGSALPVVVTAGTASSPDGATMAVK